MLGSLNPDPLSPTSPVCFGSGRTLDCAALLDRSSDSGHRLSASVVDIQVILV